MNLVAAILARMPGVSKPQMKYLLAMFTAMMGFMGRANRTNLQRYGAPSARTQYRHQHRPFNFSAFNMELLKRHGIMSHNNVLAIDATFCSKSGKKTEGLGYFWNGSASIPERGLEFTVFALVDLDENSAYTLKAVQTPADLPEADTRMTFYAQQFEEIHEILPSNLKYVVADGFYAKTGFIKSICDSGLDFISRLRKDASLHFLYTGEHPKQRGRKRKYGDKLDLVDLKQWEEVKTNGNVVIHKAIVASKAFQRNILVVRVSDKSSKPDEYILLFSTDIKMDAKEVLRIYKARFQIEFIFRDAKQGLGLEHGQMRDMAARREHVNLVLATLNVLRLEHRACVTSSDPSKEKPPFSIHSIKMERFCGSLIGAICKAFSIAPDTEENLARLRKLPSYVGVAA